VKLDDFDVAARNDASPGDYVMIAVSDTGKGMPPSVLGHVFEPFFTTKGVGEGSGLGLSMVHGFVHQSGGFVTIDGAEGVGVTVHLYLPRAIGTGATPAQRTEAKFPVSRGERILVVEDDPDVRALTVNMLAELGYETVEAADGNQAIQAMQDTRGIDLLFTDVVLPGDMSGFDIAQEARRRFPGVIKILLTSGYADNVLKQQDSVERNFPLIEKPFQKATLADQVRASLDRKAE
jgi:CheY-like chemotaxis protein